MDLMLRPTGGGHFQGDFVLADGDLALDGGLNTAVLVSLFTDRRAEISDELPSPGESRRGWWGDGLNEDRDRIGSRLWLLVRRKQTPETRRLFEDFTREALAWLIADGLAAKVEVTAEWRAMGVLGVRIVIHRPGAGFAGSMAVRNGSNDRALAPSPRPENWSASGARFDYIWLAQEARMEYLGEVIV